MAPGAHVGSLPELRAAAVEEGWCLRGGEALPPQRCGGKDLVLFCLPDWPVVRPTESPPLSERAGTLPVTHPAWINTPRKEGGSPCPPPPPIPLPAGVTGSLSQGDGTPTEGAGIACRSPLIIRGEGALRQTCGSLSRRLEARHGRWQGTLLQTQQGRQAGGKLGLLAPTCAPAWMPGLTQERPDLPLRTPWSVTLEGWAQACSPPPPSWGLVNGGPLPGARLDGCRPRDGH
uniref:Uncharacterized protein n=1 Tax=Felis catus TaxID=9685 RepID=A0ABI7ZSW2_FELCA